MEFVNPYCLTDIQGMDPGTSDLSAVKRARKKILAELELSENGMLDLGGRTLAKTDVLRALDDMEDSSKRRYFSLIWEDGALEQFLERGSASWFDQNQDRPHYSEEGFRQFVGPFFGAQFNRVLWEAFDQGKPATVRTLTSRALLLGEDQEEAAFKRTKTGIQEIAQQASNLQDKIKGGMKADEAGAAGAEILAKVHTGVLNALPDSMAWLRDEVGNGLRNLSIALYNEYDLAMQAYEMLARALELNLGERTRAKLLEDEKELGDIKSKFAARAAHPEIYAVWDKVVNRLKELSSEVDDKGKAADPVKSEAISLVDIGKLSRMPEGLEDLHDQIGRALRNLGVSIWNKHNDADAALALVMHAFQLKLSGATREDLNGDLKKLEELRGDTACYYCRTRSAQKGSEAKIAMFKVTARHVMSKSYQKASVPVQRCGECQRLHGQGIWIYLLSILVAFIPSYFLIAPNFKRREQFLALIVSGVVGVIVGLIAGWIGSTYYFNSRGTRRQGDVNDHPLVKRMLAEGYKFGEEPGRYD